MQSIILILKSRSGLKRNVCVGMSCCPDCLFAELPVHRREGSSLLRADPSLSVYFTLFLLLSIFSLLCSPVINEAFRMRYTKKVYLSIDFRIDYYYYVFSSLLFDQTRTPLIGAKRMGGHETQSGGAGKKKACMQMIATALVYPLVFLSAYKTQLIPSFPWLYAANRYFRKSPE